MQNALFDKARAARYPWRAWYSTPEWKALRAAQLRREPHCRFCAEAGAKTPADTVDHTVRHRGRRDLFFDPRNLASLCKRCHDSTKQQAEALGYSTKVDANGLPTDPRHPFNR